MGRGTRSWAGRGGSVIDVGRSWNSIMLMLILAKINGTLRICSSGNAGLPLPDKSLPVKSFYF